MLLNIENTHSSWQPCLREALTKINPDYLKKLYHTPTWLPGHKKIFNAFTLPVEKINYVLFGESPYPRAQSANGYAFWDEAVTDLWSATGLTKPVNRATSLRNLIKMLLIAEEKLEPPHTTQADIAKLDKKKLIQTNGELFHHFLQQGFLLLNASLVLQDTPVQKDAKQWYPFIRHVLHFLIQQRPALQLILLGNIANTIDKLLPPSHTVQKLYAEHPYNISFITNPKIIAFFKPFHLLLK